MSDVVIAGYARTPFHFAHKGALTRVRADEMAAAAVKAVVERTGVDSESLEDLILGNSFPEGEQGFNMARLVVLMAGLPEAEREACIANWPVRRFTPATTLDLVQGHGAVQKI